MRRLILPSLISSFVLLLIACGGGSPKALTTSTDPKVIAKAKVEDERSDRVTLQMYEAITPGMDIELVNMITKMRGVEKSSFQGRNYTVKTVFWENWDGSYIAASFHGQSLSSKSQNDLPSIPGSANHFYEAQRRAVAQREQQNQPLPKPEPQPIKPFETAGRTMVLATAENPVPVADDRKILEQYISGDNALKSQIINIGRVRILTESIVGDHDGAVDDCTYVRVEDGSTKGKVWVVKTVHVKK